MPFLHPPEEDERYLRRLFQLAVAILLVTLLVLTRDLILLAFGSLLIALLLCVVTDFLKRMLPFGRGVALGLATVALLGTLGLIGWLFYSEIAFQASLLAERLPRAWQDMQSKLREGGVGQLLLNSLQSRGTVTWLTNEARAIVAGTAVVLFNFLIVLSAAVFFAADPARYRDGLALLAPHKFRGVTKDSLSEIGMALKLWLVTQSISMIIMGGLFTLGLWLSGVPAYGALGALGGLAEFIPYVGPIIAMIPALLLAFAGEGSLIGVLLTYFLARIVQMNVITPYVTGRVVSVPPGYYIFLILAAGYIFGTFGLFFSGPLAILIYTAWLKLYSRETLGDDVELPSEHAESEDKHTAVTHVPGEPPRPEPDRR